MTDSYTFLVLGVLIIFVAMSVRATPPSLDEAEDVDGTGSPKPHTRRRRVPRHSRFHRSWR